MELFSDILEKVHLAEQKSGQHAYVVGGFVRDILRTHAMTDTILLNTPFEKDVDFVVTGSGVAFAQIFDEVMASSGSLVLFEDFDTARYVFENGIEIEFAGARSEQYVDTSRKPKVTPATIIEDVSRRDFTINAMAVPVASLLRSEISYTEFDGAIIDPYAGKADLAAHVLRTPLEPDKTFFDDPLRMMRAARFASQLHFTIDTDTYDSIVRNRARLSIVSFERIRDEFFKTLKTERPSVGLWILYETKLFEQFMPEIPELWGVEEVYGQTHKNNLSHTFKVVDNIATRTDKVLLRFAALLHDIGKPGTKKFDAKRGWTFDGHEHLGKKIARDIGKRLRMKRTDIEYVAKLVRWHQQPISLMDESITDSAVRRLIVNLGEEIDDLLKLGRSDITTGNPQKKKRRLKNYDFLEKRIVEVIEIDKLRAFQSPVRGEEIMQLCGLKPGPTVGNIKKQIEEAILDGIIPNEYDAAKAYFMSIKDTYLKNAAEWEYL